MLTHLRLILAQLIAPSGYEVANFDYAQSTATNCYFRGKLNAFTTIRNEMERCYGSDWRDHLYDLAKANVEYYDHLLANPSSEPDFED